MVAKVTVSKSIRSTLAYHEKKVHAGKAACIHASGFLRELHRLDGKDKLLRFEQLIALNKRTLHAAVHVSLNFAPGDHPSREQLARIGSGYMTKAGLGEQPFLIYEHYDAGHPHVHIVSVNIRTDRKRISLNCRPGRQPGMPAPGPGETGRLREPGPPLPCLRKLHYGRSETRRGIAGILDTVLATYRFSSLPELNAVLGLYNVAADGGKEGSRIFNSKGLVYRVLDEHGKYTGMPVKASILYPQATLASLEQRFLVNTQEKSANEKRVRSKLDWILGQAYGDLEHLEKAFQHEKIRMLPARPGATLSAGIVYVDHTTRCVYTAAELGRKYTAPEILVKFPGLPERSLAEQLTERNRLKEASTRADEPGAADAVLRRWRPLAASPSIEPVRRG